MKNKEWNGSGSPPVGTVCEYYWSDGREWRECEIVAYYNANVVAIDVIYSTAVLLRPNLFRPNKTPEQIAAEEDRELAIKEMVDLGIRYSSVFKDAMGKLYDAGYRKIKVKK